MLNTAEGIVERMNGAVSLLFNDIGPVKVANIVQQHEDGRRSIFLRASAGAYKVRGSIVELIITDANGNIVVPVEPVPMEMVMDASEQRKAVRDALHFFRIGDWVSLYKVYEIIKDEVGQNTIEGWITKDTRSRFTGTAQNRDVLGDQARHASRNNPSIFMTDTMSHSEAHQVIAKILRCWLKIA